MNESVEREKKMVVRLVLGQSPSQEWEIREGGGHTVVVVTTESQYIGF